MYVVENIIVEEADSYFENYIATALLPDINRLSVKALASTVIHCLHVCGGY